MNDCARCRVARYCPPRIAHNATAPAVSPWTREPPWLNPRAAAPISPPRPQASSPNSLLVATVIPYQMNIPIIPTAAAPAIPKMLFRPACDALGFAAAGAGAGTGGTADAWLAAGAAATERTDVRTD